MAKSIDVLANSSCANCDKRGEKMLQCSACKNASYCSKECQRQHWPKHKQRCKLARQTKQTAKQEGMKRELRLLGQWKDLVRNGVLEGALFKYFGTKQLRKVQHRKEVVSVSVEFNYNRQTFIPNTEPSVVPTSTLGEGLERVISGLYQEHQQENNRHNNNILIVVYLLANGIGSIMPTRMQDANCNTMPWDSIVKLFDEAKLHSSVFSSWMLMKQANLKSQIQNHVQTHAKFQPFLVSALRIESNDPVHTQDVVIVWVEAGFGLGQITKLSSYELWPANQVIAELRKREAPVSEQDAQMYETNYLDLQGSPYLLQSRIMRPLNHLVPVLFLGRDLPIFLLPNLMEVFDDRNRYSAKHCKKEAEKCFSQLQRVTFPKVESPGLE